MGNMFKKPKMPAAPPPVTPLPDATDAAVRQRQQDALTDLKRRRGRASTILSGQTGDTSAAPRRKRTLGSGGPGY
jgi:hypothetical protein